MLLVLSGTIDGTCDRLMSLLGNRAFRFNFDIFHEYEVSITSAEWKITNPTGLSVSSKTSTGAFLWKPFHYGIELEKYVSGEVKYVFRELYAWHQRRGTAKGNSSDYHNKFGKLYFLNLAKDYFVTPETFVGWGFNSSRLPEQFSHDKVVAKSLAGSTSDSGGVLFTTPVDHTRLDPKFPWFLQSLIESTYDITVFVCGDKKFCFQRDRGALKGVDWRQEIDDKAPMKDEWDRIYFNPGESKALDDFCLAASITWGRIDFLRAKSGELVFLEFNANGQWVFLDYERKNRLAETVVDYLLSSQ